MRLNILQSLFLAKAVDTESEAKRLLVDNAIILGDARVTQMGTSLGKGDYVFTILSKKYPFSITNETLVWHNKFLPLLKHLANIEVISSSEDYMKFKIDDKKAELVIANSEKDIEHDWHDRYSGMKVAHAAGLYKVQIDRYQETTCFYVYFNNPDDSYVW